eukprot:gnl/TRDRNA2_/TRDRNA2_79845_c0_seq1.p1 gnl/TRDRNA2_/TRDRNA2_79845_c0~~gnl/TRDRNA2_/TRDRNA2_79845_c0_seq1.p1  ORF type:complete len:586 (+),score=82.61 gnl/TRDRNA2_/TRDRNA2_79845_c0_seq1:99-1760(+)
MSVFANMVPRCPGLFTNRAFPDRDRGPEEPLQLTFAIGSGDADLVQQALTARKRACRWSKAANATLLTDDNPDQTAPFTAMDVAMLIVYFPHLGLQVLEHPTMLEDRADGTARIVRLEEAASLDTLLDAALASEARDQVLATPIFVALLDAKMKALWPFFVLEATLLSALFMFYGTWAFGTDWAATPALVLSVFFAMVEIQQLRAVWHPLFGDPARGRLSVHLTDAYNVIDILCIATVLWTVGAGVAAAEPIAVTGFLLLLKLIGTLRAFEDFGFLVSMLLTTLWSMRFFGLLFVLMIGGFTFIFELLARGDREGDIEASPLDFLWKMYRFGTLGDFDSDDFETSPWVVFFFVVFSVAVNIMMLNVLITIVGEGYSQAQANRVELSRQTCAGTILDLERTYLWPLFSTIAVRRGKVCRLVDYPACLAYATGLDLRPVQHIHILYKNGSQVNYLPEPRRRQELELRVRREPNLDDDEFMKQREALTERALLRQSVEDITKHLNMISKQVVELRKESHRSQNDEGRHEHDVQVQSPPHANRKAEDQSSAEPRVEL